MGFHILNPLDQYWVNSLKGFLSTKWIRGMYTNRKKKMEENHPPKAKEIAKNI